jgi:antirestriction protein
MDTPRVWIGCLGCYNGGRLVGDWVDADEADDFAEHFTDKVKVPGMHIVEAHEELWCMDHENFYGLLKGECSPSTAQKLGDLFNDVERDHVDMLAVIAWATVRDEPVTEWDRPTEEAFREAFVGEYDSIKDYAYDLVRETGWGGVYPIPDSLEPYLDFDSIAEELRGDHSLVKIEDSSFLFRD